LGQIRFEYGWDKNLNSGFTFGFGQVFWYNFFIDIKLNNSSIFLERKTVKFCYGRATVIENESW
jgi:hypothetical protein